jgi:hypothetical protein
MRQRRMLLNKMLISVFIDPESGHSPKILVQLLFADWNIGEVSRRKLG